MICPIQYFLSFYPMNASVIVIIDDALAVGIEIKLEACRSSAFLSCMSNTQLFYYYFTAAITLASNHVPACALALDNAVRAKLDLNGNIKL